METAANCLIAPMTCRVIRMPSFNTFTAHLRQFVDSLSLSFRFFAGEGERGEEGGTICESGIFLSDGFLDLSSRLEDL